MSDFKGLFSPDSSDMRKKITIEENGFMLNGRIFLWNDVASVRIFSNPIFIQLSSRGRMPRVEIFLKSGKELTILSCFEFFDVSSIKIDKNGFNHFMEILKTKVNNSNTVLFTPREGRLIISIVSFQFLGVGLIILLKYDSETTIMICMTIGLLIGLAWNYVAGRKMVPHETSSENNMV